MQKIAIHIILLYLLIGPFAASAQNREKSTGVLDSLKNRIALINKELPRLEQKKDAAYYATKRELGLTYFYMDYEQYVQDEELERAKDLIDNKLEKAELMGDNYSVKIYRDYKERLNMAMKLQRMKYQQLLSSEKTFRKEINKYIKEATAESYQKARHITDLALKYAVENKWDKSIAYLKNFKAYIDALIFDYASPFDLHELTRSKSSFEKVFNNLLNTDSLSTLKKADTLLEHCYEYSVNTKAKVTPEYFKRQKAVVATAISDYLERSGQNSEIANMTDQAVVVRRDSINYNGVFKWHQYVVVINTFIPSSSSPIIQKGEAIIDADKTLMKYMRVNKLGTLEDGDKMGRTFLIPFKNGEKRSEFQYYSSSGAVQYMACYTMIISPDKTKEISKYLPPMIFKDEQAGK
jgi:hypothetical protein